MRRIFVFSDEKPLLDAVETKLVRLRFTDIRGNLSALLAPREVIVAECDGDKVNLLGYYDPRGDLMSVNDDKGKRTGYVLKDIPSIHKTVVEEYIHSFPTEIRTFYQWEDTSDFM